MGALARLEAKQGSCRSKQLKYESSGSHRAQVWELSCKTVKSLEALAYCSRSPSMGALLEIIKKHKEAYQAKITQIEETNPSKPALLSNLEAEMQYFYARDTHNAADAMRQEHAAGGGAAAASDPTRATV